MSKKGYLVIVGIVVAAVLLSILLYTILSNHRPVITSLEAEPERVILSGKCQIVCNAADPDGNELSYGWSADGGVITGKGATVSWTAPQEVGIYNLTVVVKDGYGGSATGGLDIDVFSTVTPANTELEQVKAAVLSFYADHGVWPPDSSNLTPNYISKSLKAVYTFDTSYGWLLGAALNPVDGWTGITFQAGTPGPAGQHGRWDDGVSLIMPADGATNVSITKIGFAWTRVETADSYNWVLSRNADLASPIDSKIGLVTVAYTCTRTLTPNTVYYWRVTAMKDGANISMSTIGTFCTVDYIVVY